MANQRWIICSEIPMPILLIGLVTHRFLRCKKCDKITSHRYDLTTDRWECIICGELREEESQESQPDHHLTPVYSSETINYLIRATIILVLMFLIAYILVFYIIPLL